MTSSRELRHVPGFAFVRRGPSASGWKRSADLLYVCDACGSAMPANCSDYFACQCRTMHLDVDAGRFGADLGDHAILTYRKLAWWERFLGR